MDRSFQGFKIVTVETCCVCLDEVKEKLVPCGHDIHIDCVIKLGKQLCPVGQQSIKMTDAQKQSTIQYNNKYKEEDEIETMQNLRAEEMRTQLRDFYIVGYGCLSSIYIT